MHWLQNYIHSPNHLRESQDIDWEDMRPWHMKWDVRVNGPKAESLAFESLNCLNPLHDYGSSSHSWVWEEQLPFAWSPWNNFAGVAALWENVCCPQDLPQLPFTVPTPITRIISHQVPGGQMQSVILEEIAYTKKKKKWDFYPFIMAET